MTNKIEIVFLGTGSHIPTDKRNHTGILLSYGPETILFDCGEGIQRQFRIAKLNPCKLTRIFITHWHGDHTLGLIGLLETLSMSEYQKTLYIYGPTGIKEKINTLQKLYGKFRLNFEVHEIVPGIVVKEKEFFIEVAPMLHNIPAYAYSFIVKDKVRLNKKKLKKLKLPNSPMLKELQLGKDIIFEGKKIKASAVSYLEKGKKIAIIMDTAMNINAVKIAKNSDLLICESSFYSKEADRAKRYKHLTSKEAAMIAKKAKAKSLILTHISCRYEKHYLAILKEARKIFKNSSLANDFDKVIV